jgi:hypothetical protein
VRVGRRSSTPGAAPSVPPPTRFEDVWREPAGLLGWLRTINNIPIAHRYMLTAFGFFLLGGMLALFMRIQLGTPENTFLDAATYVLGRVHRARCPTRQSASVIRVGMRDDDRLGV